jgi:hypothetical protein
MKIFKAVIDFFKTKITVYEIIYFDPNSFDETTRYIPHILTVDSYEIDIIKLKNKIILESGNFYWYMPTGWIIHKFGTLDTRWI